MKKTIQSQRQIKKFIVFGLVLALIFGQFLFLPSIVKAEEELTSTEKSIVKVCRGELDLNFFLENDSCGSGIIINSSGLILTNAHVANNDRGIKLQDPVFGVYINEEKNKDPKLRYVGRLVASDESKDVALLKLFSTSGSNISTPNYLNLETSQRAQNNDSITIYGYPDIGGDTLITSTGSIIGQEEDRGLNWLKTDGLISFGSSGGAAVNENGNLIGLTTAVKSSSINSVGYLIDIFSINDWINQNKNQNPTRSNIEDEMVDTINIKTIFNNTNKLSYTYPKFEFTLLDDFEIGLVGNMILLATDDIATRGAIIVTITPTPYFYSLNDLDHDFIVYSSLGLAISSSLSSLGSNNTQTKKYTLSVIDEKIYGHIFPFRNYLIDVAYSYGDDDADKSIIDSMLDSFYLDTSYTQPFTEFTGFNYTNPIFRFFPTTNWSFLKLNSEETPFVIYNKNHKNDKVNVEVEWLSKEMQNLNNQDFYNQFISISNSSEDWVYNIIGNVIERNNIDYNYTPSEYFEGIIKNGIKQDVIVYSDNKSKVETRSRRVYFRKDGFLVTVELESNYEDEIKYLELLNEFDILLWNLSMTGERPIPIETTQYMPPVTYIPPIPVPSTPVYVDKALSKRLAGRLLLQVEQGGAIWYVDHNENKRHQVTWENALTLFQRFTTGITDADLIKIPVTLESIRFELDTDGDGYTDRDELYHGFSPYIPGAYKGRFSIDKNFANRLKSRLLLQVNQGGAIWYVDENAIRHNVRWDNLMDLFRALALGITDSDLAKIAIGD